MDDKIAALAELLRQAGSAHHEAFKEVDGADDEWGLWYADYLYEKIPAHVGKQLTRSEIVYALKRLDYEYKADKPSEEWATNYARLLLERYA